MSTTIPEVLQAPNMLGHVEAVKAGLPTRHLPPALLGGAGITRRVDGNTFTYTYSNGNQTVDPFAAFNAKSTGATPDGIAEQSGKTLTTSRNIEISANDMLNLMDSNGVKQRMGEAEVLRQLNVITIRRQNTRIAAISSAIILGNIYLDSAGNLLPSSSGAAVTIAMPTPTTCTKSASWQTAATDILGDIAGFQAQALRTTGYEYRYAIYGSRVMKSLMDNTNARDLIVRNMPANQALLNGQTSGMIFDFAGLTWYPGQYGFFTDSGGTKRQWLTGSGGTNDQDGVVFLPEIDPSWYELIEGTTAITGNGAASADPMAMWAACMPQQGMYQYAVQTTDPVGMKVVYGDNFFPLIKVTGAIGVCDTV